MKKILRLFVLPLSILSFNTVPMKVIAIGAVGTVAVMNTGCAKIGQGLWNAVARAFTRRAVSKGASKVFVKRPPPVKAFAKTRNVRGKKLNLDRVATVTGAAAVTGRRVLLNPAEVAGKLPGEVVEEVLIMNPLKCVAHSIDEDVSCI